MDVSTEIRAFCSAYGLKINTDLGQHFLIDQHVLDVIINTADIQKSDHIIEIGAGIGVLTRELLKHSNDVTAIEIDTKLIPLLHHFTRVENAKKSLIVVEENALRVNMPIDHPYKIVANIPYHITSPLLRHMYVESPVHPSSMTLLIQREVAEKICDTENAGILTILVALFGSPQIITHVPPESFLPPPKVASAVLHIESFDQPIAEVAIIEKIFSLTKLAFSQKRKMLRNTIGSLPNGMELMKQVDIEPTRRPQTLNIQEWISLARTMSAA